MNNIYDLFFELIRVAIGTRICLSHTPSADEWGELYAMAKKQSLVGICFAGVQKLNNLPHQQEDERGALPEMLYLTWMGIAAKIQQRNETMKAKGEELLAELSNNEMDACILKGMSLAPYYGSLGNLRQSGDIDVWIRNHNVMELDAYVKGLGMKPHTTAAHVSYEDKDGVEIELHAEPAFFRSFKNDKKLNKWFKEFNGSSTEFNLVYMMVHMYHHVLFEGLGLRQLMDYYFVLCTSYDDDTFHYDNDNLISTIKSLGIMRFATGIMWIMKEVFINDNDNHNDDFFLGIKPNEKYGRLILEDVMTGGNFGHHDTQNKGLHGGTAVGRSLNGLKRNMKFFALGPWEIMSSPVWSLWHWWWRKRKGLM